MRLLDTWTGQFVEKDPRDSDTKYAILSHTWDPQGEQTYQELRDIQSRYPPQPLPKNPGGMQNGLSTFPSSEHYHDASLPTFSPSSSPPSCAPSSTTTLVTTPTSSFNAHADHPETVLSRFWNDPRLSSKIAKACAIARANGHQYLWIDSCCIDKMSSSELSEAINSMYQWYSRAVICFAFLVDVPVEEDYHGKDSCFRLSRWFTRGWTLQELIAPVDVRFLSTKWTIIGSKHSLADLVSEITGISYNALLRVEPLGQFSVAQRLSWAAKRETTRLEDRAYSLLGIFDINMPTLYGEGPRAFRRLQEEILRRIPDQSLFAWTSFPLNSPTQADHYEPNSTFFQYVRCSRNLPGLDNPSLFAPSPDLFGDCGCIEPLSRSEVVRRLRHELHLPAADYYSTPYGVRTRFPLISLPAYCSVNLVTKFPLHENMLLSLSGWYIAIIGCEHKDYPEHLLGRICYIQTSSSDIEFSYPGFIEISLPTTPSSSHRRYDLLPLSPSSLKRLRSPYIQLHMVYIPHAEEHDGASEVTRWTPHDTIKLVMLKKNREDLHAKGYTADLCGPDSDHPTTHRLILSHATGTHDITIEFQHSLEGHSEDQKLTVSSWVTVSGQGWGGSSETDSLPWSGRLFGTSGIVGDIPGAGRWSIWGQLTLAAKDHYTVHVQLRREKPESSSRVFTLPAWRWCKRTCAGWLRGLASRTGPAVSTLTTREERGIRSS